MNYDDEIGWCIERVKMELGNIISDYLRLKKPPLEMMERIVRDAPSDVVAKCFIECRGEIRD